jgi:hypothetical protein
VEEIMAEMRGEAPPPTDAATPPAETPEPPATDPAAEPAAAGEVDFAMAAEATGMPEHLLRRSVEAKAKATGLAVELILREMVGEIPQPSSPGPAPQRPPAAAAPAAPAPAAQPSEEIDWAAVAESQGMSEKLFRRSIEAKARKTGQSVEHIVAEMTGEPAPAAAAPQEAPAPSEPAPATPAAGGSGEIDWAAVAESQGMSEKLFRRSIEAKARKTGQSVEHIVAEMTGEPVPTAAVPAPAGAPAAATATAPAPAPPRAAPVIPEGVHTQRLLTVVRSKSIQQVRREPVDKVNVWPHLLAIEFVALLVVLAGLIIFSVFQDAPLLELANPNEQPNPSKAPWYFLGLQELLSYFDPQIAGVLIPGLGLAGLAIIPYIDRNPSVRPADRKFAIMLFTFFVMAAAILTIIGSFYRGPGFNFTYPWTDGIFFDL